jgi:hypothetical protein
VNKFDYSAPAELFRRKTKGKGGSLYLRFDTAAAAISFAVEGLDDLDRVLTTVEVDEQRLDPHAIRDLYDSRDYPLTRKMARRQNGTA